ncbi:class I adenylate-forming enzyme family protein [Variovorax sp. 770b2]|uniref:class I adenylate-forming enzyme family protein n=1 Tax=Variovorax sp. 770b2 TaxID=1566271 RepID=UPI000A9F27C6|nr:class I adenylate-forming enzyme family protein [Variovorax sp. 770b2]
MAEMDAQLTRAWDELTAPGERFEVGMTIVNGVVVKYYPQAPATLRDVWKSTCVFTDRPYLLYEEECITYAQAHAITSSVCAWLVRQGVRKGDRVAIAMRNYPEWTLIYWACVSIGVVVVGVNAWWINEELAFALRDAVPKVIFCDQERLDRLPKPADRRMIVVAVRAEVFENAVSWKDVIGTSGPSLDVTIAPDDDACIFYTSGTTGFPKGAQLTHRGCVTNSMNMSFSVDVHAVAEARARQIELPDAVAVPVALITTPLFHVTANNCLMHPFSAAGATLVLMRRWDANEALRLIEARRVTTMGGVPTMGRELVRQAATSDRDLSSLRVISGGGGQVPPDLVSAIDARPGIRPSTGYGMTEASGIIAAIAGDLFVARPTSCGRPMPTLEVQLVDDQGSALPPGTAGELWVKGAGVIKGYLNQPQATLEAIVDGWLRTGDIAKLDEDGYLHILDRKKDMVLRGGENIYCAEVEAAIFRHPAVAEACAFSVPDERLGEEVGAVVVLREGHSIGEDDLRQHVAAFIAQYKVPKYLWFSNEPLPRNASGKFLRKKLRETLSASVASKTHTSVVSQ